MSSLALYRKYRPATFAEVIGQEHVTEPLQQALRSGRLNHAYLFSGPRGCGKTSSARILARSLNCEQGPDADAVRRVRVVPRRWPPTAPAPSTSSRSTRPPTVASTTPATCGRRAFFAPVGSRFKVYIIDEAHMVTRRASTPCSSSSRSRRSTSSSSSRPPSRRRSSARSGRGPTTTRSG